MFYLSAVAGPWNLCVCVLYGQPPLEPENACLEALRKLLCPCSDFSLGAVGEGRPVGQGVQNPGGCPASLCSGVDIGAMDWTQKLFLFASGMLFRVSALRQAGQMGSLQSFLQFLRSLTQEGRACLGGAGQGTHWIVSFCPEGTALSSLGGTVLASLVPLRRGRLPNGMPVTRSIP